MGLRPSVSERAEADLAHQYRWYLDNAGQEVAERYLVAFHQRVENICLHSRWGRSRRFRAKELEGIRSISVTAPFEKHLIFYRLDEDVLSIERVMHGARDLSRRLMEPPED